MLDNIDIPIDQLPPDNQEIIPTPRTPVGPYDQSQEVLNRSVTDDPTRPQGLLQNISSVFDYGHLFASNYGREQVLTDIIRDQYWAVRDNNLLPSNEINNSITDFSSYHINPEQGKYDAYIKFIQQNPDKLIELQQQHPELGLKSYTEIQKELLNNFSSLSSNMDKVSQDNSTTGWIGRFIGGAAGFAADPIGFASMLTGGGISGSILRSFVTMSGKAALGIAGAELINKPGEVLLRNTLGENVTTEQAIFESASTISTQAVFAGGLGILGHGLNKILSKPGLSKVTKDKLTEAQSIVNDTNKILSEKPEGVTSVQHDQAVAKAFVDTTSGNNIDLSGILPKETKPVVDPTPSNLSNIEKLQDPELLTQTFKDIHEQLKVEDQVIETVDDLGNLHRLSAKEAFDSIADDLTAQKEIATCLATGVISSAN